MASTLEEAAAGATSAPGSTTATKAELEDAHRALLAAYLDVLRRASLIGRQPSVPQRSSFDGYALRALAHGHVRRRLSQLSGIYGRGAVTFTEADARQWHEDKKRDCDMFAQTLSVWWGPSALAVLPIVIASVALFAGDGTVNFSDPLFYVVAIALIFAGFGLMKVSMLFDVKRRLFGAPASGVYACEDRVFGALGWGKPREFPFDVLAEATGTSLGILAVCILTREWIIVTPVLLICLIAMAVLTSLAAAAVKLRRRRALAGPDDPSPAKP